jgi:cytochrome c biogenesis protein CcmG, thiol:disulfide interchange protein DsbE
MRRNLLLLVPPLVFAAFAAVAWFALQSPDEGLPTALAGREAPSLSETVALRDDPAPTDVALRAPGAKLVNFWASWCAPCRVEHPILADLARSGVPIIGVNYKDKPENARGFLDELGDPYVAIGADESGRTGIDWGLYGVPETFVIDGEGRVVLRHAGPITPEVLESRIMPAIEAAGGIAGEPAS